MEKKMFFALEIKTKQTHKHLNIHWTKKTVSLPLEIYKCKEYNQKIIWNLKPKKKN